MELDTIFRIEVERMMLRMLEDDPESFDEVCDFVGVEPKDLRVFLINDVKRQTH
jgi:hypothetical protein